MHGILLEICQKKKRWQPMLMKWSWYVFFIKVTFREDITVLLCSNISNLILKLNLFFLAVYGFEPNITIIDVLLCLMCRSWRVCPWRTRWRSSCASSARSTSWLRRRKRSHRYQTWAQVGFYSAGVTPPPFTVFLMSENSMLSITFFFYNLPLVRCSARLTVFARQLEGKYMTV